MAKGEQLSYTEAKRRLVFIAGEAARVIPGSGTEKGKIRRLRIAMRAARNATPPMPHEEIDRVIEDAKATRRDMDTSMHHYVSRWLKPKDTE